MQTNVPSIPKNTYDITGIKRTAVAGGYGKSEHDSKHHFGQHHSHHVLGEIVSVRHDNLASIRLTDGVITLQIPSGFRKGDAFYGMYTDNDVWQPYAVPANILRKETVGSTLILLGIADTALNRLSLTTIAGYMPVVSKGDIALFSAATDLIIHEYHLPESDAIGLVGDLHRHGAPLTVHALHRAMPSLMSHKQFMETLATVIDALDGQHVGHKKRLLNLVAVAADIMKDAQQRIRIYQLSKRGEGDETFYGILSELRELLRQSSVMPAITALLDTLESRYFINLCALAAGLPMRFWLTSTDEETVELSITRTQHDRSVIHTVTLNVETEALGLTGIHLTTYEQHITAGIFASTDAQRDILSSCSTEFSTALGKLGYSQRSVSVKTGELPIRANYPRPEFRLSI